MEVPALKFPSATRKLGTQALDPAIASVNVRRVWRITGEFREKAPLLGDPQTEKNCSAAVKSAAIGFHGW